MSSNGRSHHNTYHAARELRVVRDRDRMSPQDPRTFQQDNQREYLRMRNARVKEAMERVRSDPRWREEEDFSVAERNSMRHPARKLSPDQVREMRRAWPVDTWVEMPYPERHPVMRELSERYGITPGAVDQLLAESSWCWVE